ncbi:colanic acid biosynthesis glycosyltransferase WcaI [Dokdonia sinensis]|uniref:Colanic acid biosynthesis glycosyltransferase WcaI n=1 Tax=Dokdonia sinensis TaxID=2479847 RepID=A0A3M0FZX9_9FLAO|nr:WcaI family glycosyltransferase [Dokdonia sinensis]RMB57958.1 colanic acid biosynthesis glycosyltransferase WcaI [Dokdonia sinensis]
MDKTHITLIGLNFFPESTAIGLYSTQMAQYLENEGMHIDVITAFPYYPEWKIAEAYKDKKRYLQEDLGSIKLYRYKQYVPAHPTFFKRVIHILSFTWGSFWNLWKIKKCDIVISVVPFTSSTFLGYIQKKRFNARSWIHIQDFEFDAAFQSGLTNQGEQEGGLVYRLLMHIEKKLFSKADIVSTISQTMLKKLEKKTKSRTYFLPNWIDGKGVNPAFAKAHPHLNSSKFKILYSGNIGDKQDWAFFKLFAERLDCKKYEVIIVGAGSMLHEVSRDIRDLQGVTLFPPVPYEELNDLLCSANVHILFQKAEVLDTVMPSKILGMMASATPSIITGHPDSEVATTMEISGGGFYSSDTGVGTVLKQLEILRRDSEKSKTMGIKAREFVLKNFSKDEILSQFVTALKQL